MMKLSLITAMAVVSSLALGIACGSKTDRGEFPDPGPADPGSSGGIGASGALPPSTPPDPIDDSPCGQAASAKGYAGCDFKVAPSPIKGMISDAAPCYAVFL